MFWLLVAGLASACATRPPERRPVEVALCIVRPGHPRWQGSPEVERLFRSVRGSTDDAASCGLIAKPAGRGGGFWTGYFTDIDLLAGDRKIGTVRSERYLADNQIDSAIALGVWNAFQRAAKFRAEVGNGAGER